MIKTLCLLLWLAPAMVRDARMDLVHTVAELHKLNWSETDVPTAAKYLGVRLTLVEAEVPPDSTFGDGTWDGSVYATNAHPIGSVRLEFRKSARPDAKCAVSLYSARLD